MVELSKSLGSSHFDKRSRYFQFSTQSCAVLGVRDILCATWPHLHPAWGINNSSKLFYSVHVYTSSDSLDCHVYVMGIHTVNIHTSTPLCHFLLKFITLYMTP